MSTSGILTQKYSGLILAAVLVTLHASVLYQQQRSHYQPPAQNNLLAQQTNYQRYQPSSNAAAEFSQVFGVKPILATETTAEPKAPDTLPALSPKLLAVDERDGVLTARIWLEQATSNQLQSITLQQSLLGYQLTELSLTQAVFKPLSGTATTIPAAVNAGDTANNASSSEANEPPAVSEALTLNLFHIITHASNG